MASTHHRRQEESAVAFGAVEAEVATEAASVASVASAVV